MNGNWRLVLAAASVALVIVGFVLGSMTTQLRASDRFVPKDQYERDITELKGDVKQLLQFHMEDRNSGR